MSRRRFRFALAAVASLLGLLFVASAEACFNPEASVSPKQAQPGDTVIVTVSDLDAEDHFFIEVNGERVTDDLQANSNVAQVRIVVPDGDKAVVDAYIYDSRNKANSDSYVGWEQVRTPIRSYNTITRPAAPPSAPSSSPAAPQDAPANSTHTSAPVNAAPPAHGGGTQGTRTPGDGGPNAPVATGGAEVADTAGHVLSPDSSGAAASGTGRTAALVAARVEHVVPSVPRQVPAGSPPPPAAERSTPATERLSARRHDAARRLAPRASRLAPPYVDDGGPPIAVVLGAGLLFLLVVGSVAVVMGRRYGGASRVSASAGPSAPVPPPATAVLPVPAVEPDHVEIELQELIAEERARQLGGAGAVLGSADS